MNIRIIAAFVVAAGLSASAFAASDVQTTPAQTPNGLTRAQVRADLAALRKAGYDQSTGDEASYPVGIQAAEAQVAAQSGNATSYGGVVGNSKASGAHAAKQRAPFDGMQPVYFGQ